MSPPPLQLALVLSHRLLEQRRFSGARVRIGRAPDNDLVLDNPLLSRHHLELVWTPARGWTALDLSTNGISLNGDRAPAGARLRDGDRLALGKFTLLVGLPEEGPPGPATAPPEACLTVVRGSSSSRAVYPLRGSAFHLGSDPACQLRPPGLWVPRRMAVIARGQAGYSVLNVTPSGRGVLRNGRPVALREPLQDGDRIEVGRLWLRFHVGAPPGAAPSPPVLPQERTA